MVSCNVKILKRATHVLLLGYFKICWIETGTTTSTCWARGGICIDIRECPSLQMDVGVPGCSWGYKVCCKVHKFLSPTVGLSRRYDIPVVKDLQDLGASLDILALRNSMLLTDWKTSKSSNSDEHQIPSLTMA